MHTSIVINLYEQGKQLFTSSQRRGEDIKFRVKHNLKYR